MKSLAFRWWIVMDNLLKSPNKWGTSGLVNYVHYKSADFFCWERVQEMQHPQFFFFLTTSQTKSLFFFKDRKMCKKFFGGYTIHFFLWTIATFVFASLFGCSFQELRPPKRRWLTGSWTCHVDICTTCFLQMVVKKQPKKREIKTTTPIVFKVPLVPNNNGLGRNGCISNSGLPFKQPCSTEPWLWETE